MHLSSQVGTGSEEQDFAGSVDNSFMISCTDVGSNSVSGSTSLGMMTGAAAAAVDARILATLSTKNLALGPRHQIYAKKRDVSPLGNS